jgi:hypothetical protein
MAIVVRRAGRVKPLLRIELKEFRSYCSICHSAYRSEEMHANKRLSVLLIGRINNSASTLRWGAD